LKRACIDTHAIIWHLSKPKRLGRAAARLLREADAGRADVLIPAIVPIELALLREAGRKVVGPVEIEALLAVQPAFTLVPLGVRDALEFAQLQQVSDPFDRMVIAAARVAGVPLITADEGIEATALVQTIWD